MAKKKYTTFQVAKMENKYSGYLRVSPANCKCCTYQFIGHYMDKMTAYQFIKAKWFVEKKRLSNDQ